MAGSPASPEGTLPPSVTSGSVRRTVFVLAMPVLAEQILNTFVALFDTWLAGTISASATAAVGLAAYVSWLVSMIVMLVGTGTTALVARHAGAGELPAANHVANQSLCLAVVVGAAVGIVLASLAPALAFYANMSGSGFAMTVRYLRIDAVGHLFLSVIIVICASLRGMGDMRMPMAVFAVINVINIIVSSVLVFAFDLGVDGIVLGTVTARVAGGLLAVGVLARGRFRLQIRRKDLRPVWASARRILRIGLPAAADGTFMWSGHFAFLAIIARAVPGTLGQASLAAHIITVRVEALIYLPAVAWATAAATIIGQSLGARDPARARHCGHVAVLQCGLLSVVVSITYYFAADWIFAHMTGDVMVREIGVLPFKVLSFFLPLLVISIVYIGGLRGAGDTRVPMLITMAGIVIRLSLGIYFGLVLELGLLGAWMGMFGDMVWRALAASRRFLSNGWVRTAV